MTDDRAARPNTVPSARFGRASTLNWPWILLGGLIIAVIAGTIVYPTYTNYDSTYSLL